MFRSTVRNGRKTREETGIRAEDDDTDYWKRRIETDRCGLTWSAVVYTR